jgi:hypothetical protein
MENLSTASEALVMVADVFIFVKCNNNCDERQQLELLAESNNSWQSVFVVIFAATCIRVKTRKKKEFPPQTQRKHKIHHATEETRREAKTFQ